MSVDNEIEKKQNNQTPLEEYYDAILNRIYNTKKARMNSEARLIENSKFYQIVIIYYSLFTIGISIYTLIDPSKSNISAISIITSIAVLSVSIYISAQEYSKRALLFNYNYNQLGKLEDELYSLKHKSEPFIGEDISKINQKYQEALINQENHIYKDYEKINRKTTRKIWNGFLIFLKYFIWFGLPILAVIIYSLFFNSTIPNLQ